MNRTLSALLAVAFLAAAAPNADAQTARQARHEVEASMLVTGHVDIDRDGTVTGHVLDQPEKLPSYVVDLVERSASGMRFDPILVDGVPALARAKMRLRLIATPSEGGTMNVRIASAHFGDENDADDPGRVRADSMLPPRYPVDVARMGGTGVVYLLLKIDRDGLPEDVVAEQVNLTALGTAPDGIDPVLAGEVRDRRGEAVEVRTSDRRGRGSSRLLGCPDAGVLFSARTA